MHSTMSSVSYTVMRARPFGRKAPSISPSAPKVVRQCVTRAVLNTGDCVVVAGSTGGVGQLVVAKLLDRGYRVRAVTRDKAKAQRLFSSADQLEVLEVDLRDADAVRAAEPFKGCHAAVMATGTTAFPSDRWVGGNGPRPTDLASPENFISAAPTTLKRFALCTSAGVERYTQFPFAILNTFGVLVFKKATEDRLAASGIPYTIVRPSRLTDGPYTSYDLNTLLQSTSGNRQDVQLSAADDLVGEASRIATAELLVQSLLLEELAGRRIAISSTPGEGPGGDSSKWKALLASL